jgi:hypothetical protein
MIRLKEPPSPSAAVLMPLTKIRLESNMTRPHMEI